MLDMINAPSVDFLFTSGKPYRFNTAGIECIYFAENEKTARANTKGITFVEISR